jgi:hypothetical protein
MVVVGAGRVGTALAAAALENGETCVLIRRGADLSVLQDPPGSPILVAVGADDLDGLVPLIPDWRRGDLVFVQNGVIGPWLADQRLGDCTRAILFFAATGGGALPQPGPFPSVVSGPQALTVVRWLVRCGVPAHAVEWPSLVAAEVEKLLWIVAFGALCQRYQCDLGTACSEHAEELAALVRELQRLLRATHNVDIEHAWLLDRLVRYSRSIPTWTPRIKEWGWRNGWFVAEALRLGVPTPVHGRLLWEAGFQGGGVEHLLEPGVSAGG